MGHVNLLDTFGDDKDSKTIMIRYLLANAFTYYNILIGRPTLNELGVIISTPHLAMKYPSTSGKIIIARADQAMTQECYASSLKITKGKKVAELKVQLISCTSPTIQEKQSSTLEKPRAEPTEEVKPFQLDKEPSQCTKLGFQMSIEVEESRDQVLTKNADLFTWSTSGMLGINPKFHCYWLAICLEAILVVQRKRKLNLESGKTGYEEANKILDVGFIREV